MCVLIGALYVFGRILPKRWRLEDAKQGLRDAFYDMIPQLYEFLENSYEEKPDIAVRKNVADLSRRAEERIVETA